MQMLNLINNLPIHIAGIHAFADVTANEYKDTLVLLLDGLIKRSGKIYFILILETDIKNFTPGAWCGNINLGLRYFFKWKKVAIVTDQKQVLGYSDLFKYFIPGKFEKFPLARLDEAIKWVSDTKILNQITKTDNVNKTIWKA